VLVFSCLYCCQYCLLHTGVSLSCMGVSIVFCLVLDSLVCTGVSIVLCILVLVLSFMYWCRHCLVCTAVSIVLCMLVVSLVFRVLVSVVFCVYWC
jgi:hypothetical protein